MKTQILIFDEIIFCVSLEKFQEWLLLELQNRNWSQRDLARRAKISQGAVSHVLSGARQPGADFCLAIAKVFNVSAIDVFQKAGILPPDSEMDTDTRTMVYLFGQLSNEARETLISMARVFIDQRVPKAQAQDANGQPRRK